jgi:DNA-directed RNA polymerase specialized sigma24 family protein
MALYEWIDDTALCAIGTAVSAMLTAPTPAMQQHHRNIAITPLLPVIEAKARHRYRNLKGKTLSYVDCNDLAQQSLIAAIECADRFRIQLAPFDIEVFGLHKELGKYFVSYVCQNSTLRCIDFIRHLLGKDAINISKVQSMHACNDAEDGSGIHEILWTDDGTDSMKLIHIKDAIDQALAECEEAHRSAVEHMIFYGYPMYSAKNTLAKQQGISKSAANLIIKELLSKVAYTVASQ